MKTSFKKSYTCICRFLLLNSKKRFKTEGQRDCFHSILCYISRVFITSYGCGVTHVCEVKGLLFRLLIFVTYTYTLIICNNLVSEQKLYMHLALVSV